MLLVRMRVSLQEQGVTVLWDHLLQDKHYFNINVLRHTNKVGRYAKYTDANVISLDK